MPVIQIWTGIGKKEKRKGDEVKGLEVAENYYEIYGKKMIHEIFPEYEARIAVGLIGGGAECFGFDDVLSETNKKGPAFCMWLTREDFEMIGLRLQREYSRLPGISSESGSRKEDIYGNIRGGVWQTGAFYRAYTGRNDGPKTLPEWLYLPEYQIAAVTNGKVFRDDLGDFSIIRERLKSYYPEDVRRKKMAERARQMARAGQYNYVKMMARQDIVAARIALDKFIVSTISMIHLLNFTYTPVYKWAFKNMEKLPRLNDVGELIKKLAAKEIDLQLWQNTGRKKWNDKNVMLIEKICKLIIQELRDQRLTFSRADSMEVHAQQIELLIEDKFLAKCRIKME